MLTYCIRNSPSSRNYSSIHTRAHSWLRDACNISSRFALHVTRSYAEHAKAPHTIATPILVGSCETSCVFVAVDAVDGVAGAGFCCVRVYLGCIGCALRVFVWGGMSKSTTLEERVLRSVCIHTAKYVQDRAAAYVLACRR